MKDRIPIAVDRLISRTLGGLPKTMSGARQAARIHAELARRIAPALGMAGFEHLVRRAYALVLSSGSEIPALTEGMLDAQLARAWRTLEAIDPDQPVRVASAVASRLAGLLSSLIGEALVEQLLERELPIEVAPGRAVESERENAATADRVLERVLAAALEARDAVRAEQLKSTAAIQARTSAEAQRVALQSEADLREQLVAILGHDLANPLLSILLTSARLLEAGDLPPELTRLLEGVLHSAERMQWLVSEVIEFAGVRSGSGLSVEPRPMELEPLCRRIIAELESGRSDPGRFDCHFHGNLEGCWDPERLAQIVSNIAGNALTHGAPNAPVRFEAAGVGAEVIIDVHSEGEPIAPGLIPFIFDPYRQGATSGPQGGLGLGLYIAFQLVAAHGGMLTVRSTRAEGTTFTIRLPRNAISRGAGR